MVATDLMTMTDMEFDAHIDRLRAGDNDQDGEQGEDEAAALRDAMKKLGYSEGDLRKADRFSDPSLSDWSIEDLPPEDFDAFTDFLMGRSSDPSALRRLLQTYPELADLVPSEEVTR